MHIFLLRVIKETLRASGANITDNHTIQVSLAALFLLEAAKKVFMLFVTHQTSHHSVRNPSSDVLKMCMCLLQEKATKESMQRTGSPFVDPVRIGMEKLAGGWLDRILNCCDPEPEDLEVKMKMQILKLIMNNIRMCNIPVSTWSPLYPLHLYKPNSPTVLLH